jgi:FixJ family two-component response regulator
MAHPQDHIVFIVDDDRRIREALTELLSYRLSASINALPAGPGGASLR